MELNFIVRPLSSKPTTVLVRYDCPCGCKPGAEHHRDSNDVAYEHCCCGNVHFVGQAAREKLDAYLGERAEQHNADDLARGGYAIHETTVAAPWGTAISVAYGIPNQSSEHSG